MMVKKPFPQALAPQAWCQWIEPWHLVYVLLGVIAAGLFSLGYAGSDFSGWLGLVAFALIGLAWAAISVAGTSLAARLSSTGEGKGLGIFNAATALAVVAGKLLGGWAAGEWVNNSLAILCTTGSNPWLAYKYICSSQN